MSKKKRVPEKGNGGKSEEGSGKRRIHSKKNKWLGDSWENDTYDKDTPLSPIEVFYKTLCDKGYTVDGTTESGVHYSVVGADCNSDDNALPKRAENEPYIDEEYLDETDINNLKRFQKLWGRIDGSRRFIRVFLTDDRGLQTKIPVTREKQRVDVDKAAEWNELSKKQQETSVKLFKSGLTGVQLFDSIEYVIGFSVDNSSILNGIKKSIEDEENNGKLTKEQLKTLLKRRETFIKLLGLENGKKEFDKWLLKQQSKKEVLKE